MDQSTTLTKLLRVLRFRKHIKELTSACKRINKDGCYEFVTAKSEHSKKRRKKKCSYSSSTVDQSSAEHLSSNPTICPVNLSMMISQSYKPLHAKSTQFNKNTIAVTKGTIVQVLYTISNWVFIEIIETGQTGFIPMSCLHESESTTRTASESPVRNNISLFNVSIYDKPRESRRSIIHHSSENLSTSTQEPGRFISSIGPCYLHNDSIIAAKSQTFTRPSRKDDSILSQQISNISLDTADQDAYETLNFTPRQDQPSSSSVVYRANNRLRVMENYQRQFVGDISVLESEVVTLVKTPESNDDWRLVRRGDGKQGFIPKHILTFDQKMN